jgi:hypothetical protein
MDDTAHSVPRNRGVTWHWLQLTGAQHTYWSARKQVLLVEFGSAHKIGVIHIAAHEIADQSDWMAFEEFSLIAEQKGA